jgi:hypothetical protein
MKLTNSIEDYSPEEIAAISNQLRQFGKTLSETDTFLNKEIVDKTPPEEGSNVVYINVAPLTEYKKLINEPFMLHDIVTIYMKWNDILSNLVIMNMGQYGNKKVVEHLVNMRLMVATLGHHLGAQPSN